MSNSGRSQQDGSETNNEQHNSDSSKQRLNEGTASSSTLPLVARTAATRKTTPFTQFTASDPASKRLLHELKQLELNPVEGVAYVKPKDDSLFEWDVGLFGAPDTPYQGGYFKVSSPLMTVICIPRSLFLCLFI